jgi:hypothetical protein
VGGNLATSVAGSIEGFAVREYLTHGSTDGLFGSQGGVITPITGFLSLQASGIALQSGGNIVILGTGSTTSSPPTYAFALVRYTPEAEADHTFGTDVLSVSYGIISEAQAGEEGEDS